MPPATFDINTTADEAAKFYASEIQGKVVLITGASPKSLAYEMAKSIVPYKPKLVILAGRDQARTDEAVADLKKVASDVDYKTLIVDFGSLASAQAAAKEVDANSFPIDVLILSAGRMATPFGHTVDGFETQFGTNHLGPFVFTNLIKPRVLASASPRIVVITSDGHQFSDIRYGDTDFGQGKEYDPWQAYGQSKTANLLFAVGLNEKWAGVKAFALHPGSILGTTLGAHIPKEVFVEAGVFNEDGSPSDKFTWKTPQTGAAVYVVAAFDPTLDPSKGVYLLDCQQKDDLAKPYAIDKENARKLWALSETMVNQTF
ncbi:short-chain dehydrogenase [Pseudohyphozyma bogoriensis]|nr:short-chain dehydrogenase [Pseudohyphozyma bogoriensis]